MSTHELIINSFAEKMRTAMDNAVANGRTGWDEPTIYNMGKIRDGLRNEMSKGEWVDVAVCAMMMDYHHR